MFYADEVIYIFESQNELLRIPRLPLTLSLDSLKEHYQTLRKLSLHLSVEEEQLKKIPDTLLMVVNNEVCLSSYGTMIWEQIKKDWYIKELLPSPHEKIRFSKNFERDVERLPPDRLKKVNERIDDLVGYVERKHNPPSLDFKQLRGNPRPPSTHECDAWSDRDARRIFAHFEGNILVLDALDRGLH